MPEKINLSALREKRDTWSELNLEVMDEDVKSKYLQRKKAVDLYIDGMSPSKVSEQTGISSGEVIRLVHRCSDLNKSGNMAGYKALLPNNRTSDILGKFNKLFLEYPTLESFVLGNYFGDKHYTLEHNMNIRSLHTKFREECIRLGIQDYEYPLCLKDNGYDALYRYLKRKEKEMQQLAIKRATKTSQQHFAITSYGESYNINPIAPYNIVQLDGHKIDMIYSVEVENEHGEVIRMPATRAWLITVMDVATRAIIGYAMSPYENYNQHDVLQAIYNAIKPHKKINFSHESLKYPENDGFPSLCIPETKWAAFDVIMLDNAKSHLAQNVIYKLNEGIKCVTNFGSVATPETRGIVERFFRTLEMGGFHRLPGTTGSHIYDNKRNNPEKEAVKYEISYNDICELVEYLIAEYNNSAHSKLENQTPLQVMARRIHAGMQPYIDPVSQRQTIEKLTYFTEERILRGGYKTGTRPYLSYLGVRYHAVDVQIPMQYVGKKVYIEVNPEDVSHVKLYDTQGIFLADMIATGEWGKRPHSIKTHKAALKRKSKNLDNNSLFTPHLTEFEEDLRKNAKNSRRDRTFANIMQKENCEKKEEVKRMNSNKVKNSKRSNTHNEYSKEEMALIDSMSIEEAYRKGLI